MTREKISNSYLMQMFSAARDCKLSRRLTYWTFKLTTCVTMVTLCHFQWCVFGVDGFSESIKHRINNSSECNMKDINFHSQAIYFPPAREILTRVYLIIYLCYV